MTEFEWRVQMRELRRAQSPRHDLWAAIDAAMDAHDSTPRASLPPRKATRPHRWIWAASLAASLLCVVTVGWHVVQTRTTSSMESQAAARWKPSDPRLVGAAIELHAAHMELQQALQQAPNSPALQRLLQRTTRQQNELRQLAHEAS